MFSFGNVRCRRVLPAKVWAGIVVGTLIICIIIIASAVFCDRRRRRANIKSKDISSYAGVSLQERGIGNAKQEEGQSRSSGSGADDHEAEGHTTYPPKAAGVQDESETSKVCFVVLVI